MKQKFIDTEKIKIIDYLEYQGTEYTLSLDKESKECFLIKDKSCVLKVVVSATPSKLKAVNNDIVSEAIQMAILPFISSFCPFFAI